MGLAATAGACFADKLGPLNLAFAKVESVVGGVILGVFLLGALNQRVDSNGALAGGLIGMGVVSFVAVYAPVSLYWRAIIGCGATMFSGWLWSSAFPRQLSMASKNGGIT
jgi:hypothetical protein